MKRIIQTGRSVRLALGAAVSVAVLTASTAGHAIVYNQNLLDPPGVYFGGGNVNGFWAVDVNGGVELGLRAVLRQQAPSASSGDGTYGSFATGTQKLPAPNPARATWNYEFSINVRADSDPDRTIADSGLTFEICADTDTSSGVSYECVDPIANWSDNGFVGTDLANSWGQQNSQQLLFGDSPGHAGYDINATGLYDFRLTAYDGQGGVVARTEITAAVPEPASLALFGLGLVGLGLARRRRTA